VGRAVTRQRPRPSAYRWLWEELERRFGTAVAAEIKAGYAAQSRAYQHDIWHGVETPRGGDTAAGAPETKARLKPREADQQ